MGCGVHSGYWDELAGAPLSFSIVALLRCVLSLITRIVEATGLLYFLLRLEMLVVVDARYPFPVISFVFIPVALQGASEHPIG
jgi:hypothetical protein